MKLLHTSDWHFGMPLGTGSYIEEQKNFLEQLYAIIEKEKVDAVLCAGDVYDSSVSNAEAIELYNAAMTHICFQLRVPAVIIAGNHDSGARLATCRSLLKGAGLHVTGKLTRDIEPVLFEGGKVAVYAIPFFNREEVRALFPERSDEIRSEETAYQVVLDNIRAQMDPAAINIAVAHALIVDAEISESDRSAKVGHATAVSKSVFDGFDYVALGHIHKPQVISPTVRYSGSPIKYSFGAEEKQEKGVVIFDTEAKTQTVHPLSMLHDKKSVRGTLEEVKAMAQLENCYLHIELTDEYAGNAVFNELRLQFPYLLELRGKSLEESGTASSLTLEELDALDEIGIMEKFMEEICGYQPTEQQRSLFEEAVAQSQREADLG